MKLYMEMESEKSFRLGASPTTVLPSRYGNQIPVEIRRRNQNDGVLKRRSIYQSSKSVRKMKELGDSRRKYDRFTIVESLHASDNDSSDVKSSDRFFEITLDLKRDSAEETIKQSPLDTPKSRFFQKMFDVKRSSQSSPTKSLLMFEQTSPSSPAHMFGDLKLESRHGVSYFRFSVKSSENAFVAKTWKTSSSVNYTFHIGKKKSDSKESSSKDWSMVGQMQVSCYIDNNSNVTQFVLYDLLHARNSLNTSSSPWTQGDLHPYLEAAAIVFEAPFEKTETRCVRRRRKIRVITGSANHGMPKSDCGERGPSSLLDRWRFGGGCDCGGWDMGCPLLVFGNPTSHLLGNQRPFHLFLKGAMEKIPALTIKLTEEGEYAVEFHAQLSTLQAFSICVAMLHVTADASTTAGHERNAKALQRNPIMPRKFGEDVKSLVESVTKEEMVKKNTKKVLHLPLLLEYSIV